MPLGCKGGCALTLEFFYARLLSHACTYCYTTYYNVTILFVLTAKTHTYYPLSVLCHTIKLPVHCEYRPKDYSDAGIAIITDLPTMAQNKLKISKVTLAPLKSPAKASLTKQKHIAQKPSCKFKPQKLSTILIDCNAPAMYASPYNPPKPTRRRLPNGTTNNTTIESVVVFKK